VLEARTRAEHFVLFLLRDFEVIERGHEVLHRGVPVLFGDAHPLVSRFHVAAHVDARSAGGGAKLLDHVLADFPQRVLAVSGEETGELFVGGQTADEVVGDGGDGVVSARALIERLLRRGRVGGERRGDENRAHQEQSQSFHWMFPPFSDCYGWAGGADCWGRSSRFEVRMKNEEVLLNSSFLPRTSNLGF